MKIGRKIYYDKATGNVVVTKNECSGLVAPTTLEQDIASFRELAERIPETFDFIDLEYGQYRQDFAESIGHRVNPETKTLEFMYPDPNAPEEPAPEPVYQTPLSEEVKELKQENTLIKAQNQALTERADFIEDVVAEMAVQVYQ